MTSRRRRIVALLTVLASLGGGTAIARASVVTAAVSDVPVTRPLPSGFLGLALEYNTIPTWFGSGQTVDPVLERLIRNLDPVGRPVLRVGGQSTDRTWWPVRGMARPLGVTYDLTPSWTAIAHRFAQAMDLRMMLGVNLEADRTRISQVEAAQLLDGVGRPYVDSLQIGNEPDLYPVVPWYRSLHGHPEPWYGDAGTPVYSRGRSYSPAGFTAEFARTLRVMPRVAIAGPETSRVPWMAAFSRLLTPASPVRALTTHAYPLINCVTDPASPQYPSVPNLLSLTASRNLLGGGLRSYVGVAHRAGASFRVDEMGSISCNGRPGVSDTMASALWSLDALFSLARAGVDGVNLHTYPNSVNSLFNIARSGAGWEATVRPLYYGALLFAEAAPEGSQLLRVASGDPKVVRIWATRGSDNSVRVLLINDSLSGGASIALRAPAGYGSEPGAIESLLASSAYAQDVTLGGQSFGTTTTGALGAPVPQTVAPRAGSYEMTLPSASATLLTLSPP
ncbi:MAG: hypothetical protein JOZ07_14605 [Solirubrobacterales bacterium]|nr:hypothetical protein [Solirubrobacterales bacterium]